eukprot:TRINITY_DN2882_c0_g1_i10.p1 TRINITY_DN2882_c0_g1~~TRINITY_DN2882_c0_g1_i10.p1  ORF type:complete len:266 (+),score=58.67 TRINITY_DN2882_c0_g1_i10:634-1431(+)
MYFNMYEILYFAYVLEKLHKYLMEEERELKLVAIAYRVKVDLNTELHEADIFKNCSPNNIYVRAKNFAKDASEGMNRAYKNINVTIPQLNEKYQIFFKSLNKIIGEEDLQSILDNLVGHDKNHEKPEEEDAQPSESQGTPYYPSSSMDGLPFRDSNLFSNQPSASNYAFPGIFSFQSSPYGVPQVPSNQSVSNGHYPEHVPMEGLHSTLSNFLAQGRRLECERVGSVNSRENNPCVILISCPICTPISLHMGLSLIHICRCRRRG